MLVLAGTSPAHAEWRRARTDHFVLTIDDTEDGARSFATRLERFDAAMRLLYNVADTADRRARPIAIYALRDKVFYGTCYCGGILGYYRQRVEGSFIFSLHDPDSDRRSKAGSWSSQTLLLHEYSHHFLFSNFPIAYPYWFSEGFAEFNANTSFEEDGSLIVGYPANYRAEALKGGSIAPNRLFDPERYGFIGNIDLLYGRGWLLTHYLMLHPARAAQLSAYLDAMNRGKLGLDAARIAFGDLDKLDDELDAYRKGQLAAPLRIPPPNQPVAVQLETLDAGETAMMPVHLELLHGAVRSSFLGVAIRAGKIAERFPDNAVVQARWADAEFYARRYDRADAAIDKALTLKPDLIPALLRKGSIAVARAMEAKSTDAAIWSAARSWFLKANKLNPNEVMPLYLYYTSFVSAKAKPTLNAVTALKRAAVLAPESTAVRLALARQTLLDGDARAARSLLQPVAFSPHRARDENVARQIVVLIDGGRIDEAKALMTKGEEDSEED